MILGNDSTFNNVRFSDYNLYVCDFDDNILKDYSQRSTDFGH